MSNLPVGPPSGRVPAEMHEELMVEPNSSPEHPAPGPPADVAIKRPPPARQRWVWAAVAIVLAVGVYFLWPKLMGTATSATPAKGAGKGDGSAAVPVVAARSRTGDIGVYFTGLGTVTPLNTVTVKSRVDGQLLKVAYKEGELVHQGDVLAEIDPRPYQVLLEQANGQLAKDQAALASAKVDLTRDQKLFSDKIIAEMQVTTQQALVAQDQAVVDADKGPVDSAKLNISYCNITAPITGRIGLRLVDTGNIRRSASGAGAKNESCAEADRGGLRSRDDHQDCTRIVDYHRQRDRSNDRHAEAAGNLRQSGQCTVSQSVCKRKIAGGGKAWSDSGADGRHPAQHFNHLRVRGEAGFHRDCAHGHRRCHARR